MAAWQSEPGATLLVPSGPGGLHLFIFVLGPVVLPAYGPSPQTAMVSITSIRSGVPHDAACEVNAGDHPFIHHPSYVAYRYMRLDSAAHVELMVSRGVWTVHAPCSPQLLDRVVAGARTSRLMPREFRVLFAER